MAASNQSSSQRARAAFRSLRKRADRAIAAQGERSAKRLTPHLPYSIRLEHRPTADLRPRYGYGHRPHPGLDELLARDVDVYVEQLQTFVPFFDELAKLPLTAAEPAEPQWMNEWLIGLDTVALYGFVRTRQPKRYVEVGSGQSTKVVARARTDGGLDMRITSIDPSPRVEIDWLCDDVIRSSLEEADLARGFGELSAGDMVFFDGSHRLLPNSDCVAFFLDILPSLPPGVLVGIHDIYLPDDYPPGFVEVWWSEQYVLGAILLAEPSWLRVVLPSMYASGRRDVAAVLDPLFELPELAEVNRRGSSFWLETRAR